MKTKFPIAILFFGSLAFLSVKSIGQSSVAQVVEGERFNIKINFIPSVPGQYRKPAFEMGFERRFHPRWSCQTIFFAGQMFYSKSKAEFNTTSGNSVYEAISISYIKGAGVTGELRYYVSKKHDFTKGFYFGGYVRGLSMRKVREDLLNDQQLQGPRGMILGFGADLGYKFKFGRWTIEPLVGLAFGWNTVWDTLPKERPNLGDPLYQAIWDGANEVVTDIEYSIRHVPLWRGEFSLGYSF